MEFNEEERITIVALFYIITLLLLFIGIGILIGKYIL